MTTKKKAPTRIAAEDPAPTVEELVTDEAPSIEEIAQQAPVIDVQPEEQTPLELPLEALPMIVWIGPHGERFHIEPWTHRGEYQLRPYYGA